MREAKKGFGDNVPKRVWACSPNVPEREAKKGFGDNVPKRVWACGPTYLSEKRRKDNLLCVSEPARKKRDRFALPVFRSLSGLGRCAHGGTLGCRPNLPEGRVPQTPTIASRLNTQL